jgi:hypothetical protein
LVEQGGCAFLAFVIVFVDGFKVLPGVPEEGDGQVFGFVLFLFGFFPELLFSLNSFEDDVLLVQGGTPDEVVHLGFFEFE